MQTVHDVFVTAQQRQPYVSALGEFGWACECHGGPHAAWAGRIGWHVVSAADWCPRRHAVSPGPTAAKVRDSAAIRAQAPLHTGDVPPGLTLPADVHRLIPRLLTLTPAVVPRLTYSLHWWSVTEPIERPPAPPDADRVDGDARDQLDVPEPQKRKGRTTRDVPVLRESLALRAWPLGVQLWLRLLTDETAAWKPDGGYVRTGGVVQKSGIIIFKQELTKLEKAR